MGRGGRAITIVFLFATLRAAAAPLIDLQLVTGNVTNPTYITHAATDPDACSSLSNRAASKSSTGRTSRNTISGRQFANAVLDRGRSLEYRVPPGYATNGQFFVYFTQLDGNNLVARSRRRPQRQYG